LPRPGRARDPDPVRAAETGVQRIEQRRSRLPLVLYHGDQPRERGPLPGLETGKELALPIAQSNLSGYIVSHGEKDGESGRAESNERGDARASGRPCAERVRACAQTRLHEPPVRAG